MSQIGISVYDFLNIADIHYLYHTSQSEQAKYHVSVKTNLRHNMTKEIKCRVSAIHLVEISTVSVGFKSASDSQGQLYELIRD